MHSRLTGAPRKLDCDEPFQSRSPIPDPMSGIRPAERRQLTVMLCDMVASTALSLRLDPEELAEVIQVYRQRCAEIITGCGGIVARYVGDGILAYFGYPRAHENDAERAIRAALAIARTEWPPAGPDDMRVHIGIATGLVVVGNLPQAGEDLSAIGSALNLAARLEAVAGPGMVVVSEETRRLSRGLFEYRDLGRQNLKGFDQPVPAWQVLAERPVGSRFHALRAPALTPLVDRGLEVDELRRLWGAARTGQGQALLLSSEPGVGKSRLAQVLAKRIVESGCLRLCTTARRTCRAVRWRRSSASSPVRRASRTRTTTKRSSPSSKPWFRTRRRRRATPCRCWRICCPFRTRADIRRSTCRRSGRNTGCSRC